MKDLTLDNLLDIQTVSLDKKQGTIKLSTGSVGDGACSIDLGCIDEKASGFNANSFLCVIRLVQTITGNRFCAVLDPPDGIILYQRKLPPAPKPIEYRCGRCGTRITAQTEEMARTLRALHQCG